MASPRRIVLVLDYSPDYLGGAQTAFASQVALLAQNDHVVLAVTPPSTTFAEHCRAVGAEHLAVPARFTIPGLQLPFIRNTRRLRRRLTALFDTWRPDAVHVHSEFGLGVAAVQAAKTAGVPVVHTVHTVFWQAPGSAGRPLAAVIRAAHRLNTGLRNPPRPHGGRPADDALRGMTTAVARLADVVVSPSAHQGDVLRSHGVAEVHVIPNSVADIGSGELPAQPPLRLLWAARCEPEKRLLEFLDAVAIAQRSLAPGRLEVEVAGEGGLLATARRRGVPGTTFLGRVPHERMGELLRRNHLLAVTSYGFDNQPMTIVEAIGAGRGVLVCDPRLREGLSRAGFLCDADPEPMAAAIVRLAEQPDTVRSLCLAASSETEFSPAAFLRRLDDAYDAARRKVHENS
ncbi:MAG TPA: glycosyltransferase [Microbacterium sp.]|uniref:glycosyltransferase family 4 protein n=1 Tax=Microbacterium sp. TaxID=51671 RepID=UPI002B46FF15|nr:glycosyltransferase [Microbacterium sp.]HKT56845.1 glycosyltransferase [Microbacterium sp.]